MQIMEIAGYGARIYSHTNPYRVSAFVVQYFMIVCVSATRRWFLFFLSFFLSFFLFGVVWLGFWVFGFFLFVVAVRVCGAVVVVVGGGCCGSEWFGVAVGGGCVFVLFCRVFVCSANRFRPRTKGAGKACGLGQEDDSLRVITLKTLEKFLGFVGMVAESMDGREDGRMDGWMNRKMDEWSIDEGRMDRWTNHMDGSMLDARMHDARCSNARCTNGRRIHPAIHLAIRLEK
jgi:hypothetical protein